MKSRKDFETEKEFLEYLKIYFAAMALQGLAANPEHSMSNYEILANMAVKCADALINTLNTPTP